MDHNSNRSIKFIKFGKRNRFQHHFTAPYHPQSNDQAERFVDTFKRSMKKIASDFTDAVQEFLSTYRNTPNLNLLKGKSPAGVMFGRMIRTKFDLLLPKLFEVATKEERKLRKFNKKDKLYAKLY